MPLVHENSRSGESARIDIDGTGGGANNSDKRKVPRSREMIVMYIVQEMTRVSECMHRHFETVRCVVLQLQLSAYRIHHPQS